MDMWVTFICYQIELNRDLYSGEFFGKAMCRQPVVLAVAAPAVAILAVEVAVEYPSA
jgi:hypothetical protein